MGNGKCGQMSIMVNTEDRDGAPFGMGHMGGGAHGQCGHVLDHVQLPLYCMDLYKNFTGHRY